MEKIIGLGKTGCGIAEEFSRYPEYRIYKIGDPRTGDRGSLDIEPLSDIEEYESAVDSVEINAYLRSVKAGDEILFIVGGGDPTSGMALAVLEQIRDANISVLYVAPDREVANTTQKRDDKIVFNILQQYTRSGLFERMFLVDRATVEDVVGDVSIKEYDKSVYHFIASTVAMVNYYDHTDPVLSNKVPPGDISRIGTFGISSLDPDADIKYLFPLKGEQDAHHYYGIPHDELEENSSLMREIKTQTKKFTKEGVNTSFSVYSTTFDTTMVLLTFFSKDIQVLIK